MCESQAYKFILFFSFSPFASAATINEMLIRSLINQSELLYDIYNYTLMIPDLSLMLQQKLNLSTGQTTETDGSSLKVITAKPGKLTTRALDFSVNQSLAAQVGSYKANDRN